MADPKSIITEALAKTRAKTNKAKNKKPMGMDSDLDNVQTGSATGSPGRIGYILKNKDVVKGALRYLGAEGSQAAGDKAISESMKKKEK